MASARVHLPSGDTARRMAQQVGRQLSQPSPADVRLHADERPHGRQDVLAWAALLIGSASFLLAAIGGSLLGAALGVLGFAVAAVAQMFSVTTYERWLIMPGWALAFVGAILNLFFLSD